MSVPYQPMKIVGNVTGLVQSREEFLIYNDAYPVLENAFVWRERIKRKQGVEGLGRFSRSFIDVSIGTSSASAWSFNLFDKVSPPITETNKELKPGSVVITIGSGGGAIVFTDQGDGTLTSPTGGNSGTINYQTGAIVLTTTAPATTASKATFTYYPCLPVMGLRNRDTRQVNGQQTIGFDTVYAYVYSGDWTEYLPGSSERWTGTDADFFWTTNYWNLDGNPIMWVTNNFASSTGGDPIRYTDGVNWYDFQPDIDLGSPAKTLFQCRAMLPFRGRLLVFNTWEGPSGGTYQQYPQRVRWSGIGEPIPNPPLQPWIDSAGYQGGYLDIPTNEEITAVGFVRDNLVIYCSRSTWQLRYTGRTISPFQIERVNPELGAEATFSSVQFDKSLVGIGDKGIVECDSFESRRIDIKIPDLVFQFSANNTPGSDVSTRVYGIRDFVQRLAYWLYPYQPGTPYSITFPNRRLVYNYENDSWAIFTDSLTVLGTFFPLSGRSWANTHIPWDGCNFPWTNKPQLQPDIIAGNQQGFVFYLDSQVSNDPSLTITAITGFSTSPTQITSPNHNLTDDQVIKITDIAGSGYSSLNNGFFGVSIVNSNVFKLYTYNPESGDFDIPQLDSSQTYIGGGLIEVRDGFNIKSKKFNFIDQGESFQLGYIDILTDSTDQGAFTLQVYNDYQDSEPVNTLQESDNSENYSANSFFNSIVSTANPNPGSTVIPGSKYWQRVYCPVRANFITIVWTLSNAQLIGVEQESDVQIDAQIIWQRPAGRLTNR